MHGLSPLKLVRLIPFRMIKWSNRMSAIQRYMNTRATSVKSKFTQSTTISTVNSKVQAQSVLSASLSGSIALLKLFVTVDLGGSR